MREKLLERIKNGDKFIFFQHKVLKENLFAVFQPEFCPDESRVYGFEGSTFFAFAHGLKSYDNLKRISRQEFFRLTK